MQPSTPHTNIQDYKLQNSREWLKNHLLDGYNGMMLFHQLLLYFIIFSNSANSDPGSGSISSPKFSGGNQNDYDCLTAITVAEGMVNI